MNEAADICVAPHKHDPDRQRRAADGAYLCLACINELRHHLHDLATRHVELGAALATGSIADLHVSGSPSEPLPINPAVADHRHQIIHDLVWWCIYVADERGINRPDNPDPAVTAAWLRRHVDWIAANRPAAEELLPVLRQLSGRAWGLLHPARKLPTGERCRIVGEDGQRCDGAVVMRQGEDETWSAWCPECGAQEAAAYLHDGVSGRWVTIERVEAYVLRVHGLRVARATIRDWVRRGHVTNRVERERTWYDLGSVHRYLMERAEGERITASRLAPQVNRVPHSVIDAR